MSYELRPLSLAEILDAAFRLVQTEWRTLVGLAMIMQIPVLLITSQASWLLDPMAQPFDGAEPTFDELMAMGAAGTAYFLAYLFAYPFIAGAVTASVGNFYLGRHIDWRGAAEAGRRSFVRLIATYIVYIFAIGALAMAGALIFTVGAGAVMFVIDALGGLGTAVGVLGGIALFCFAFFWMLFGMCVSTLLPPVVVLESRGIWASLRRVFELGGTGRGRLIGVVITSGLIVGVPVTGAQMMIGFVPYVGLLVWAGLQAVAFAFTTSVAVVLYFDLRCRAEHYDLELLAEQVEAGPGLGQ